MYSKSLFSHLLAHLPQSLIYKATHLFNAERYDKSFKVRDHLTALLFGQFARLQSLRDLVTTFNSHPHAHYHLGMRVLSRSTLSDANQRRNPDTFRFIVEQLMASIHRKQRQQLGSLLTLIDSTPIHLSGHGFEWTGSSATQRTKGLKVHMAIDSYQSIPSFLQITDPNINDITPAKLMTLEANTTYVFDKGYYDYSWWHRIDQANAHFVTRFKKHAGVDVINRASTSSKDIIADETVLFRRTRRSNAYRKQPLRRITVIREGKTPLVLATNDFERSAEEIAGLYKQRWKIELFFKWLKQHLKIKRFMGRSRNAVLLQIYAAIIGYLLLWLHRQATKQTHSTLHDHCLRVTANLMTPVLTTYQRERQKFRLEKTLEIKRRQYALTL